MKRDEGFTLIEMIVALAIMALVAAVVFPQIRPRTSSNDVASISERIASTLRAARSEAIRSYSDRGVAIDVNSRKISTNSGIELFSIDKSTNLSVTYGRQEDSTKPMFMFFPQGTSTGGKIIVSRGTDRREIAVNWVTGAINVQ